MWVAVASRLQAGQAQRSSELNSPVPHLHVSMKTVPTGPKAGRLCSSLCCCCPLLWGWHCHCHCQGWLIADGSLQQSVCCTVQHSPLSPDIGKEGSEGKVIIVGTARAEKTSVGEVAKTWGEKKKFFFSSLPEDDVVLLVWVDL